MASKPANLSLDHVVLLLPYDMLLHPPSWLTDHLTISPGGVHGDEKTENRLVLFRDGTYLELIAFIHDDPAKRAGHWWDKPFGVVDYAFTTTAGGLDYEGLQGRLREAGAAGISYARPKAGGRLTPEGRELKWEVTFPEGGAETRGTVPFFCSDVTPRERRVPLSEPGTTHPCGALGMAGVLEEVPGARLEGLKRATGAALGLEEERGRFETRAPVEVPGLKRPSVRFAEAEGFALTLLLQTGGKKEAEWIRRRVGDGVVSIGFE